MQRPRLRRCTHRQRRLLLPQQEEIPPHLRRYLGLLATDHRRSLCLLRPGHPQQLHRHRRRRRADACSCFGQSRRLRLSLPPPPSPLRPHRRHGDAERDKLAPGEELDGEEPLLSTLEKLRPRTRHPLLSMLRPLEKQIHGGGSEEVGDVVEQVEEVSV